MAIGLLVGLLMGSSWVLVSAAFRPER
jgi:LPS O-antigen subunit length determinant protein (WzzB/FepE family)